MSLVKIIIDNNLFIISSHRLIPAVYKSYRSSTFSYRSIDIQDGVQDGRRCIADLGYWDT